MIITCEEHYIYIIGMNRLQRVWYAIKYDILARIDWIRKKIENKSLA